MKGTFKASAIIAVLFLLVVPATVSAGETWVTATSCYSEVKGNHWVTATTAEISVDPNVWQLASTCETMISTSIATNLPITALAWLIIMMIVPLVMGLYLGRLGYIIGAVVIMVAMSITDSMWWWGALLVAVQSAVILYKGGMTE